MNTETDRLSRGVIEPHARVDTFPAELAIELARDAHTDEMGLGLIIYSPGRVLS